MAGGERPPVIEAGPAPGHRTESGYGRHGLEYPAVLAAKRGIAPVAAVARAFLVREAAGVPALPAGAVSMPFPRPTGGTAGTGSRLLLAVELMRGNHDPHAIARRLAHGVTLPGPAVVTVLTRRHRGLRRALARVGDSLLFERTRRRAA